MCGIDAALAAFPNARQIAAFDTAFHKTLSEAAAGYALPADWSQKWNLQRFGFHGFSVAWSVDWVRSHYGTVPARMIVAHLGSGCSVTALRDGHSIDTTMGFTPVEGLVMATRSGSVDPGMLLWLLQHGGVAVDDLADALVFTGGVGERSSEIRTRATDGLDFLGVTTERTLVIEAREDLEMARQVRACLG
jgi:acetate kinase